MANKKLIGDLNVAGTLSQNDVPLLSNLAADYDPTATYAAGDYCIHEGALYRCAEDISVAEAWNASHWIATKVGPDLAAAGDVEALSDAEIEEAWTMPDKGQIIKLDGGPARYRVLKISGSVAEVLAMDDVANSAFNASSVTTVFSDGSTGQKYENSALDNYMTTFYNSLSSDIKNAIIQKNIIQSIYSYGSGTMPNPDFIIMGKYSSQHYKRKGQISVGDRYCYAIDIDDVIEYLEIGSGDIIPGSDINTMFFEQTAATGETDVVWLASADVGNNAAAMAALGWGNFIGNSLCKTANIVRPAFRIDLSQIDFTIEE